MASAIGMVTGDQPEEEVIVIRFFDGEEGRNQWSARGGLLQLPCNVRVGVLELREYIKDCFPLRCLEVQVGSGFLRSKEQGVS